MITNNEIYKMKALELFMPEPYRKKDYINYDQIMNVGKYLYENGDKDLLKWVPVTETLYDIYDLVDRIGVFNTITLIRTLQVYERYLTESDIKFLQDKSFCVGNGPTIHDCVITLIALHRIITNNIDGPIDYNDMVMEPLKYIFNKDANYNIMTLSKLLILSAAKAINPGKIYRYDTSTFGEMSRDVFITIYENIDTIIECSEYMDKNVKRDMWKNMSIVWEKINHHSESYDESIVEYIEDFIPGVVSSILISSAVFSDNREYSRKNIYNWDNLDFNKNIDVLRNVNFREYPFKTVDALVQDITEKPNSTDNLLRIISEIRQDTDNDVPTMDSEELNNILDEIIRNRNGGNRED